MSSDKEQIRTIVRGCYDLQTLRIQTGNRLVSNFRSKFDQKATGDTIVSELKKEFKLAATGVAAHGSAWVIKNPGNIIATETEFALVDQYHRILEAEKVHVKLLKDIVEAEPVWQRFLVNVRGCGPLMAGVILAEIDIRKAEYPSSLWKYAGVDVAQDGKGRSRKAEHLVEREYINKNGKPSKRRSITYNAFLKTKLVGVLGSLFYKMGADSEYAKIYYEYKHRLENHPAHKDKTKNHRHRMAVRYAVKRFLVDLYKVWREIEGLPVAPEYSEAKLGIRHSRAT